MRRLVVTVLACGAVLVGCGDGGAGELAEAIPSAVTTTTTSPTLAESEVIEIRGTLTLTRARIQF